MPWTIRKSGKMYYYRKQRIDGKVRSIYVPLAEAIQSAQSDAERAQQRAEVREAMHEALVTRAAVQAVQHAVKVELHQTLEQAGFHNHRGSWRKRRARTDTNTEE
jgi:hypothetical protein